MKSKGGLLIFCLTVIVFALFFLPNKTSAAEAQFLDSSLNKIKYEGTTYSYLGEGWEIVNNNDLKTTSPCVNEIRRACREYEAPTVIFKSDDWDAKKSTPWGNYPLETSTQEYIRVKKALWLNAQMGKLTGELDGTHLTLYKALGFVNWELSTKKVTISIPTSTYKFAWVYKIGEEALFSSKPATIDSRGCCGTLTRTNYNETKSIYKGQGYRLEINGNTNSFPLPSRGILFLEAGMGKPEQKLGDVTLEETAVTCKTFISGALYVGSNTDSKWKVTPDDLKSHKVPVNIKGLTPGKVPPISFDYVSVTDGTYQFCDLPADAKYELSVKIKIDSEWEDFVSHFSLDPKKLIFGGTDWYFEGKTTVTLNKSGVPTNPKSTDIILQTTTVTTDDKVEDALEGSIKKSLATVVNGIGWIVGKVADWVDDILNEGNNLKNPGLSAVWEDVRNIAISLLTLGILIIAFANVLNIQLDRYGLGAMLPKLITGIVLTYFSYLIAQFLLEIATAFQAFLTDRSQIGGMGNVDFIQGFKGGNFVDATRGVGELVLLLIILVALVVVLLWLWLLLSVRIVVIYFLVALAPLAFMMSIMPFTESLYKQWWQRFTSWTFMGPAVAFMLWLVGEFLAVGFGTAFKFNASATDSNSWVFLGMAIAALFLAGSIPLIMGKDIYSAIQKHGQKLGPVKWAQAWKKQSDKERDARRLRSVNRWRNRVGRVPGVRGLAGYKKGFLNKQENYQRMIDAGMEDYKPASRDEVWRDMGKGGLKGDIAAMYAAKNKMMPTIDEANPENQAKTEAAARAADRIIKSGRLPGMFGEVIKNQPEFFAQATLASGNAVKIQEEADKLSNFNISEMKQVQWRLAGKSEKTMKTLATQEQSLERMLQTSNMSTKIAAANAFAEGNALEHLPEHIKTELQGLVGQGPEHFVPANVKKKASAPATGAGASQTPPESNSGTGYQDGNF